MQQPDPTATAAPSSRRFQRSIDLSAANSIHGWHDVTVFGRDAMAHHPTFRDRCTVSIDCGSSTTRLYPTPDEMRALAALLLEAAGA